MPAPSLSAGLLQVAVWAIAAAGARPCPLPLRADVVATFEPGPE